MKFLLDMGLAQSTARHLQTLGYDTVHLRDQGLQRLPDDQIIQKARAEGRIILTHDLDFSRLVAISQSRLPSVITFRLKDMRPAQVNHYLNEALDHFAAELQSGALISVGENGIRARRLPVID
jgi:predicted nuclease of predicted toxin-antitoxin system